MPPSPDISPPPSALEERLKTLIAQRGPITIADYMADALSHPQEGYYMSTMPIGEQGDFTTAPEVSQVFGEIIGLWLVQSWLELGSPATFNLVELGPGRGVLMDDILRAARLRPEFLHGADIWLVETSGLLRHEQQKRLKKHQEATIGWLDRFSDVPPGPTLLVANEFFDCLPIRQFMKQRTGWHERMVGLSADGQTLDFVLAPAPVRLYHPLAEENCDIGSILEYSAPAVSVATKIAAFLKEYQGRALIIDYGHYASSFGDTFQAVRQHQFYPPLSTPGKADLTAHVDFQFLAQAALTEGVTVYGPQAQGRFLDRLGLSLRVETLCRHQPPEQQEKIRQGAHRIAGTDQMGELFKALCIASPDLPPPAGFEEGQTG